MLKSLYIQNFALLQEVKLTFQSGYTVITGETGSGKSILLNALNLLLGDRADYKVIGPVSDKAIVEAEFAIDAKRFQSFFESNDIDFYELTIIRREISTQGRSRAFINDVPVQLTTLKEFSEQLLSIHSQYNTLDLKRKEYQLEVLDTLLGITHQKIDFQTSFSEFKELSSELESMKEQLALQLKDKDYNEFQFNELEQLQLKSTDFNSIENELKRIENSDELKSVFERIQGELGADNAIVDRLYELKALAGRSARLDALFESLEERLQVVLIELKDIDATVADQLMELTIDPARKFELEQQMDQFNRSLTKHKCANQSELMELYEGLQLLVNHSDELQFEVEKLAKQVDLAYQLAIQKAIELHQARITGVPVVETELKTLLSDLKLPETELKFELSKVEQLTSNGLTKLAFLFSANKGMPLVPIENAASGGELSRVMLALQKMISSKQQMPTVFFDEIDTGVSGDVAQKIGVLLQSMGNSMQLVAISHLPQVVAKANHHFRVEKNSHQDRTQTTIVELSSEERIQEIARLMSGEQINEAAISNAKALMN